jgi:hypothetical protein
MSKIWVLDNVKLEKAAPQCHLKIEVHMCDMGNANLITHMCKSFSKQDIYLCELFLQVFNSRETIHRSQDLFGRASGRL